MQHITDLNLTHSNASGGDKGVKSSGFGAIRRIAPLLALLGLLIAGRFVVQPEREAFDRNAIVFAGDVAPAAVFEFQNIQRAGILQEIIDLLQQMLDILDGKTPVTDPEPDPEPVLTDEEQDEVNDNVDTAEAEGVDVPEERVEAHWTHEEVHGFITFVIDSIEEFMGGE